MLLSLLLASFAAEIYLFRRERRAAHVIDGHVIAPFPSDNESAVVSLRRHGIKAYPFVAPQQFYFRKYPLKNATIGLLPLSGISNVSTELCNEAGADIVYQSDIHGFNNPSSEWTSGTPGVALIGDSFVHGICVSPDYQLATLIRKQIPATLNLGVLGAGPLSELGVLREYAAPLRPRIVLWFFYEGNDIEDLEREAASPLQRYLDSRYSQHLIDKQPQIDALLSSFADSVLSGQRTMTPGLADVPRMLTLPRVQKAIAMVAANAPNRIPLGDFMYLQLTLMLAKAEVESWGGRLYLVYLPDYHRFDSRVLAYSGYVHNNAEIQRQTFSIAKAVGIPLINVARVFAADTNPTRYWPHPTSHYGPNGYEVVARTVLAAIAH